MPFSAMTYTPSSLTEAKCGAIIYTITGIDTSIYTIDANEENVVAQPYLNDPWVVNSPHAFKVNAQLGTFHSVNSNEVAVAIVNPCDSTDITPPTFTPNLSTTILGADDTYQFAEATDTADVVVNDSFGVRVCGEYSYKLTAADGTTAITWLTIADTRTLTLAPIVDDPIGVQTVRLYVKFANDASYLSTDYY